MRGRIAFGIFFYSLISFGTVVVDCADKDGLLPVNNDEVLDWKESTKNQFASRGHILGELTEVYPNRNDHDHFQVRIGSHEKDTIEIIYNKAFGPLPALAVGMEVEACGDYITSNAPAGHYKASPDGAILHWVHGIGKPTDHLPGFVKLDGDVFGQDGDSAKAAVAHPENKKHPKQKPSERPKKKKKKKSSQKKLPLPTAYDENFDYEENWPDRGE